MPNLDLDRLRLAAGALTTSTPTAGPVPPSTRPPRHKPGARFLRGPIPWDWLSAAATGRGKGLHVAVVLWHLAGLQRRRVVKWEPSKAEAFGVGRHVAYRALRQLERRGLVRLCTRRGAAPEVTILEAPEPPRPPPERS